MKRTIYDDEISPDSVIAGIRKAPQQTATKIQVYLGKNKRCALQDCRMSIKAAQEFCPQPYGFIFVPAIGSHHVSLHFREKAQGITHVRLVIFCWSSCRDSSEPGLEPCRAKRRSSSRIWLSGTGIAWSSVAMLSQRSSRKIIFSGMLIAAISGMSVTFILRVLHPIETFNWVQACYTFCQSPRNSVP